MDPEARTLVRLLRAHRTGSLVTAETARPCPTIIDPDLGRLVAALTTDEASLDAATLFVPDESDSALQLLVLPSRSEPASPAASDRYQAAYGPPTLPFLLALAVDGARLDSVVVDGAEIDLRNPLAAATGSLRRLLNADRPRLARACVRSRLRVGEEPVCVAIDPDGLDVRGRFGLVRVEFQAPAATPEDLQARVDEWLADV